MKKRVVFFGNLRYNNIYKMIYAVIDGGIEDYNEDI